MRVLRSIQRRGGRQVMADCCPDRSPSTGCQKIVQSVARDGGPDVRSWPEAPFNALLDRSLVSYRHRLGALLRLALTDSPMAAHVDASV
jgi:hypothetical protein